MTKPINEIIPRELDDDLAKVLNSKANELEEIVNYGSNIIAWDLDRADGSDEDLPPVLFLRNFLESIDAISLLVRFSAIEPCRSILRTALENLFYLEYILQDDMKNRSLAFWVWDIIHTSKLLSKADPTSNGYHDLLNKYKKDKMMRKITPTVLSNSNTIKEKNERILLLPKFQSIKQEYDRIAVKFKKPPSWYTLFDGPKNIEEMANRVELGAVYEILYRNWSSSIHGTNIINGKIKINRDGQAEIIQLRDPKDVESICLNCSNLCMMVFKNYVTKRMPHNMPNFLNWSVQIRIFNKM